MAMPTWDQTMHPALELLAQEGGYRTVKELRDHVSDVFLMTPEERSELLKSGQLRIANRVGWGITDMHKAGLIERGEKKGVYRITPEGRAFLMEHKGGFGLAELETVRSFKEWKDGYRDRKPAGEESVFSGLTADATPEDLMESSLRQINSALANDLLDRILEKDWVFFEHLVTRLVVALGYGDLSEGSSSVTKKSGDEGIDGVVRLDRLGLDSVYIQAKRWASDRSVGRPDVQGFVGALIGHGASKGLFITTAKFSKEARAYAEESMRSSNISVVLVDGDALANLMIECNVGVGVKTVYEIKAVDSDFLDL